MTDNLNTLIQLMVLAESAQKDKRWAEARNYFRNAVGWATGVVGEAVQGADYCAFRHIDDLNDEIVALKAAAAKPTEAKAGACDGL